MKVVKRKLDVLGLLVLLDLKSIPLRVKHRYYLWRLDRLEHKLQRHLSIDLQKTEEVFEISTENQKSRALLMRLFADVFPGATIVDFNEFYKMPFLSWRYLRACLIDWLNS